jgi:6,7-dimethyl-8-ribityllumazine synthase
MQREKSKKINKFSSTDWSTHSIGIVVSDFNSDITEGLLEGALDFLLRQGFKNDSIKIVHVPGSFEIPLICQSLARTKKFSGLIALGAVIKGDTDHYYYIAGEASRGIMTVMLGESIPISFGVLTTSNLKQARDRSGKKNNKGAEAAEALLNMIGNINNY